jgi:SAM-dependent methyltransferase
MFMEQTNIYQNYTYLNNNPNWHLEESHWKARQVIKVIEKNHLSPSSVCDVGCGVGEVLYRISEHLPGERSFTGYDICPHLKNQWARRETENVHFCCDDILEKDEYFDLIMALDVLEHVENYIGFVRKLKEKARYKLFHIPLDMAVQRLFRVNTLLDDMRTVGHLHFFTSELALAQLQRLGYRIIDSAYIPKRIDLKMGGKKSRLLTIPRKVGFAVNPDLTVRFFGGWSLSVLAE